MAHLLLLTGLNYLQYPLARY